MHFQGAVLREQGVDFAIVIVKQHVVNSPTQANDAIGSFRPVFPGMPIVLMAQDGSGQPTYYGRPDIARFLSSVPLHAIPWREYTIN